jgi:DinB family protein
MDREQRLEEYKDGYLHLQAALANLPPEMWHYKPAADEWSVHEILVHLADSEVHSYIRCRTILAEDGSTLMHFDEHQWSVVLQYASQDVNEALRLIAIIRRLTGALLDTIPAALWSHRAIHSKRGPMTLEDWLETYTEHIAAHIAQLETRHTLWRAAKNV